MTPVTKKNDITLFKPKIKKQIINVLSQPVSCYIVMGIILFPMHFQDLWNELK